MRKRRNRPIFEADLQPEQYAYREGRSVHHAVGHVHKLLNTGYTDVVDADLSGYFDSIAHAELLPSVARRISDRHVLALIKPVHAPFRAGVENVGPGGTPPGLDRQLCR
jgi:retron-type reverse transcriptase